MIDSSTREWLRNWETTEFLNQQRKTGRSGLSAEFLAKYAGEHERVSELLANSDLSTQDIKLARMLEAITAPLAALHADPVPKYYSYTGVNVLDEYIDGERLNLDMQKRLCVEGIRGLMLDLARFESHSMIGIEPWSRQTLNDESISSRLKLLRRQFLALDALAEIVEVKFPPPEAATPRVYSTLAEYL